MCFIFGIKFAIKSQSSPKPPCKPSKFDKKQYKTYNKHKETTGCGKPVLLKDLYSERNRLTA